MDDQEFRRYSRHILLNEIDEEGQDRLLASHALIIGLGGLGSAAAMYLASSGVGTLTLCDYDTVDLSNLQRQIIHSTDSIQKKKVDSARTQLTRLNPGINLQTLDRKLEADELEEKIATADIVLDASDNFPTRYLLNKLSVATLTPLVTAAAIQYQGHLTTLLPQLEHSPCYHCIYPDTADDTGDTCDQIGVLAPLTGVMGSLQAAETLKVLGGFGQPLHRRLLSINLLSMQTKVSAYHQDPSCPVCSKKT